VVTTTETVPDTGLSLPQYYVMIGLGAFVTTMCQPTVIGRLPLRLFLKDTLHMNAQAVAAFAFVTTFAWNVKPIAGLLSDAFPLFGTRRRHYMMLAAVLGALCWIAMALVPGTFGWLVAAAFGANAALVLGSTVMGGLMVEAGQKYGISGRVTSIRQGVQSAVSVGNGLMGGYLATMAFGWTAGIAAALLIVLAVTTYFDLTEPPHAEWNRDVLHRTAGQLRTLMRSWTLWAAGIFLALVYVSPGFSTPLLYMQTDVYKFSSPYVGLMETIEGAAGLGGAAIYALLCRRFTLRQLLVAGITVNAVGTLLYLAYGYRQAPLIHGVGGFIAMWSELALMDLAVRATPRGCESLGFALMMSARNLALGGSDVLGSWLLDSRGWSFHRLVWLNAATTALVLVFVPFLPRTLIDRRDGDTPAPTAGRVSENAPVPAPPR
jgi:MFS family permease